MPKRCFELKNSNPPTCGVHKIRLVKKQLPNVLVNEGYKPFTFLVCPISDEVLNDEAKHS
jgi:hypothetical protein